MARLPTVLVVAPMGGAMSINQCDFDPHIHQKYDEFLSDAAATEAASAAGANRTDDSPATDDDLSSSTATGVDMASLATSVEVSPLEARVAELKAAFTLVQLKEKAKALGLKGVGRLNEQRVAWAIAAYELKLEADHVNE